MAVVILFLLLSVMFSNAKAQLRNSTIALGSSLSPTNNNSFWLSESGQFAFGFYPNGQGFSVGVWFAQIQQQTVVWTANRDDPPYPGDSKLLLTDGRLILQHNQGQETPISTASVVASSASMLNSGDFVLLNSSSGIIWQTFDVPTDTILPGQRLLTGHMLVSSVSDTNHSSGKFQIFMQNDGNLVQYPEDSAGSNSASYWDTNTQNAGDGVTLNLDSNGLLYLVNATGFNIQNLSSTVNASKAAYRATIDADGIFRLYSHGLGQQGNWSIEWSSSDDRCSPKGLCGVNSYCTLINANPVCQCPPGFDFIDQSRNDFGCKKNCSICSESSFDVYDLNNVTWEEDSYSSVSSLTGDACRENCIRDISCEAALYANQECLKLKLPLRFGRKVGDSETTFLKVASNDGEVNKSEREGLFITSIVFLTLAFLVLASSCVIVYLYRIRGYQMISNQGNNGFAEDLSLRSFSYEELKDASNNFTDEIGKGSCGTVYKGVLSNGNRIVAIKRLEKVVAEGEREFRNEMKTIGKTHHKNLVQLLGYCHEGVNMLLVYEYMSHGSLADFFFRARLKRDWEGRTEIALDIARGILYLHEECETQIIHCDIKPENILMDEKGSAKVADFGLAKLLMPNQTKTFTGIRGTRGYVAPEWWHQNSPITVKADVYSFGIMLLEIICCRRSIDMNAPEDEVVLIYWVYDCFADRELDKLIKDEEVEKNMLERMVKVGLWCIQDDPSLRPSMKKVILMLEGTVDLPAPPCRPSSFNTS
ncbi:hypothetical protein REPUB_Repub16aG0062500 [Reevesia pubescens]